MCWSGCDHAFRPPLSPHPGNGPAASAEAIATLRVPNVLLPTSRYPAFRSQSLNVSKHVAVLSELARLVDVYHLLDVSQFEQELACADDHALHYRELMEKLSNTRYAGPSVGFRRVGRDLSPSSGAVGGLDPVPE